MLGLQDTHPNRPHRTRKLGLCLPTRHSRTWPRPPRQLKAGWGQGGSQLLPDVGGRPFLPAPSRGSSGVSFPFSSRQASTDPGGHQPAALSPSLLLTITGGFALGRLASKQECHNPPLGKSQRLPGNTIGRDWGEFRKASRERLWINPEFDTNTRKLKRGKAHREEIDITFSHFSGRDLWVIATQTQLLHWKCLAANDSEHGSQ